MPPERVTRKRKEKLLTPVRDKEKAGKIVRLAHDRKKP